MGSYLQEVYLRGRMDLWGGAAVLSALYLWRGLTATLWGVIGVAVVVYVVTVWEKLHHG